MGILNKSTIEKYILPHLTIEERGFETTHGNIIMDNANPPIQISTKYIQPFGECATAVYDLELQEIVNKN